MNAAFSEALATLQPRQKGRGYVARCPAHEDSAPSLNIEEKDGKVVLFCHAGCRTEDVVREMNLKMTDLFDEEAAPERVEEAVYDYRSEDGTLLYQVVRYRPKDFRQRRPLPDERWAYDLEGVDRVPYRLPQLLPASEVVIVEGEKDADRLAAAGFVATCNAAGASKWRPEWAHYFADKNVVILPDNDDPGRKHAADVRASLQGVARKVRVVDLPGLPPKGDVSDYLDLHSVEELRAVIDDRRHLKYERMGDIDIGDEAPMAIEPYVLDEGPCILFGDGGSGKSALALVLAASFATGAELIPGSLPVATGPVMWLDYEAQRKTSAKRLKMMGCADAPILYVPGLRPIAEDVDRLASIAEAEGVGLVVVDSVVLAVGGSVSPKDAEAPTLYANAVAAIAPRSIGLAHVVKSSEDDGRKPFGSGYWHNIARLTWHVKRDWDEPGHVVRLACRKRTNGEEFAGRTITFEWNDGTLRVGNGPFMSGVAGLIVEALRAEPYMSAAAISARIGKSMQHVNAEIGRHLELFRREKDSGGLWKWSLVEDAA